jgi:hypothetical protein
MRYGLLVAEMVGGGLKVPPTKTITITITASGRIEKSTKMHIYLILSLILTLPDIYIFKTPNSKYLPI